MNRPSVADVIPLVAEVYKNHNTGCCLHIVTDDDNYEQCHANFVLEYALGKGHQACIAAAKMLVQLTNTQRHKLYNTWRGYDELSTRRNGSRRTHGNDN